MEGMGFIPKSGYQNSLNDNLVERKPLGIGSYFVVFIFLGVIFVSSMLVLRHFVLVSRMEQLTKDIDDIKQQYSTLLPEKMELGTFLASINELSSGRRPFSNLFGDVNRQFLPDLKVSSVKYIKENKVIEISAAISDVNLIVRQLNKIRELDFVSNVDFSQVKTSNEGGDVSFLIKIAII
jgi:hypothetical protein